LGGGKGKLLLCLPERNICLWWSPVKTQRLPWRGATAICWVRDRSRCLSLPFPAIGGGPSIDGCLVCLHFSDSDSELTTVAFREPPSVAAL
jgi:hypothetical protein